MKKERYLFEIGMALFSLSLGIFVALLSVGISSHLFWSIVLMGAGIVVMLRAILDTAIKINFIMKEIFRMIHEYANKDIQ